MVSQRRNNKNNNNNNKKSNKGQSSSSSNKKSDKKVQFKDEQQINVVQVLAVTQEEKLDMWYTHNDLKVIRSQVSCNCGVDDNLENICTCRNERQKQHEFVLNLLRQQEEHKQMGVTDPKGLFQFSKASSKMSRQRALQLGRDQANEVKTFEERRQLTLDVVGDALALLAEGGF